MNLKGLEALDTWGREEVNPDKENRVSTRRKAEKSRVCLRRGRGGRARAVRETGKMK